MGLLDKLFGKSKNKEEQRQGALRDEVRRVTSEPMKGGGCLDKLKAALPAGTSYDQKLDAVNLLFEIDRIDWAEAYSLELTRDAACPLGIVKGLARHFVDSGRGDLAEDGLVRLVSERPSETEMAILLGRMMLRRKEHDRALELLLEPLDTAPESRHLYAVVGECYLRARDFEHALPHLRTACELYESAFKLRQILPDEMNGEQLEFTRVYALLGDVAREHLGAEKMTEAFEGLELQPSNFGLAHEAEQIAAERIDYKPPSLTLRSIAELEAEIESLANGEEAAARRQFVRGSKALREGQLEEAMQIFRETLELDLELFGAYFGWAACEALLRQQALPEAKPVADAARGALEKVCPDFPNMTALERKIAEAAAGPVASWLPVLAEHGFTSQVHPLDVRMTDIYAQRVPMRFEVSGKPPAAMGVFAAIGKAHTRLDEFLRVQPGEFAFARQLGYLIADAVVKQPESVKERARVVQKRALDALTPGQKLPSSFDEFCADAAEALACAELFGNEGRQEMTDIFEKNGVFEMLRLGVS